MSSRVLILADNAKRDLLAMRLLERAFAREGVETALYTLHTIALGFRKFRPHAVITSRANLEFARRASSCCRVYVVPSEGAYMTVETMLSVFLGRSYFKLDSVEWVRRCYLWSDYVRDALRETGMFRADQLSVVGSPRLDVYRRYQRPERPRGRLTLGVAFSAKSTSAYYGSPHYAEAYFNFHADESFPVTAKGRHIEDISWRDHAILRLSMRYLKRFLETTDGTIVFRPSPFEDVSEYLFLEHRYPGRVRVLRENIPLSDFLSEIDVLLTCWSTTGLEALIAGVPVVSIAGTMDQEHLFRHIDKHASGFDTFVPFYHLPPSEDALFDLLQQARQQTLPVSPKSSAEVKQLLHRLYNWPYEQSAASRIAADIALDSRDAVDLSARSWAQAFPLPYHLPVAIAGPVYSLHTLRKFFSRGAVRSLRQFYATREWRIERLLARMEQESEEEPVQILVGSTYGY